jgi:membrane-associated protease RseP (regulator of RpoE activity)
MHMGTHRAASAAGLACAWIFLGTTALAADAGWKPLFNGKNLNGWSAHYASKTPADAPAPSTLFKVEEGAIHVYPTQPSGSEQPNAYLETDADHKDYVLSLEYRWGEKKFAPRLNLVRDAGLLYHVHRTRPSDWPAAAEAQIQEGDVGDSWAVSTQLSTFVDPKTGRYTLPENGGVPVVVGHEGKFERTRHNRVNEYPGWNTLEVIVRGDRATHIVNGVTNMRVYDIRGWDSATNSWVKVDHGKIVLQAESAELFYRNIRIRPLTQADDMPPEPKVTEVWFPVPAKVTPGAAPGAPPSDAIILFDGKNIDAWKSAKAEGPARWKVVNGEMLVAPGTGDIQTKEKFGDVQLHVEWCSPQLPPDKVNQDRGNSGVFLQDVYELQVLDTFENKTYVNGQAASIYKQFPPLVNAATAAGNWQVYDIVFTAPRFAADGSLTSPARFTVFHNGVLVQNNVALKGRTTYIGAPSYFPHGDLPLRLQDHSHEVRFRNLWLRKL